MAKTAIYLNFLGKTEEAFNFYKSVFGGDFANPIMRMGDMPAMPGTAELPEDEKNFVMHVSLEILGGTLLMGTDMLPSLGHTVEVGNNFSINLMPDSKAEADRLYAALSLNGSELSPMKMEVWGDYFGTFIDQFGTRWMIDVPAPEQA